MYVRKQIYVEGMQDVFLSNLAQGVKIFRHVELLHDKHHSRSIVLGSLSWVQMMIGRHQLLVS